MNETYAGQWYYGKTRQVTRPEGKRRVAVPREEWIPVDVPAIVDPTTWESARTMLDRHVPHRQPREPHPLHGRVTCAVSGHRFSRQVTHKGKPRRAYVYWRCNGSRGRKDDPRRVCAVGPVKGDVLEPAVRAWVAGLPHDPERIRQHYAEWLHDTQPLAAELERTVDQIAQGERKLERLMELYVDTDLSKTEYNKRRKGVRAKVVDLEARRTELEATIGKPLSEKRLQEVAYVLDDLVRYLKGNEDDPAIPVELLMDVYDRLGLNVTVNSLDPDNVTATVTSRLGSDSFTLDQTIKTV